MNGDIEGSGDIQSMLNWSLGVPNYAFCYLFQNCTALSIPPELPATSLAPYCYLRMFNNCTSLTTAPELPATTLAIYCYGAMFYGCASLVSAPELPATILAGYCYYRMFAYCTSLVNGPSELPSKNIDTVIGQKIILTQPDWFKPLTSADAIAKLKPKPTI